MGTPLKSPPVYFTLAQVRFNPILKLMDFVPAIQERMRDGGFPDYSNEKSVAIHLSGEPGHPVTPATVAQERFYFGSMDRRHCFLLDVGALTLQSTDYGSSEQFLTKFLNGLAIVHDAVGLDFIERIGLRYLDFVVPREGDALEQYLAESAFGIAGPSGAVKLQNFVQANFRADGLGLTARSLVMQKSTIAFPPDVTPRNMTVQERFLGYNGPCAILDNDGFLEGRSQFSLDFVKLQLDKVHSLVSDAFRQAVTPHALKTWNQ